MAFRQQYFVLGILSAARGLVATKRLVRIEGGAIGNGLVRCTVAGLKTHCRADLSTSKEWHAFGGKVIIPKMIRAFRQL